MNLLRTLKALLVQKELMFQKTQRAAHFVVLSVSLVFAVVLTVLQLISSATVAYDQSERVSIVAELPFGAMANAFLILGLLGAILGISEKQCKLGTEGNRLSWKSELWLYLFFCGITLMAGMCLILGVGEQLREDPLHVYTSAVQLAGGDYQTLQPGGYLFHKAHQLGLVTYERILGLISFDVRFLFFMNLLFVNGINYLTYRLADLVFRHNKRVNILTICLTYLFVPQFFFVVFAYGLVPGFFFLLLAIYMAERYFREGKVWLAILAILSLSFAALLKSNYLIGGIVVAILCFLQACSQKKGKLLIVALLAVVVPVCCLKVLPLAYQAQTGLPINDGEPMITYVAMGINPMNEGAGPGWYDGSNYNWYKNAGYDKDLTVERAKECLRNCVTVYKNEPVRSLKFFVRKTISQWCEPMFQSVWSGPLEALGQQAKAPVLRPLFRGQGIEPVLRQWMKGMLLLIYVCASVFLVRHRKNRHGFEYAFLFFIGGFLFHLVWEAKSQYIYPYVFVLIPVCAYTIEELAAKFIQRKKCAETTENIDIST